MFSANSYYIRTNPYHLRHGIGNNQTAIHPNMFMNGTLRGGTPGFHLRAEDKLLVRTFSYALNPIPQWWNLDTLFRNDVVVQPLGTQVVEGSS